MSFIKINFLIIHCFKSGYTINYNIYYLFKTKVYTVMHVPAFESPHAPQKEKSELKNDFSYGSFLL